MKVVSPIEMSRIEKLAYKDGVSEEQFMNHAGAAIAKYIEELPNKPKITLLCGSGNNGGDGYVAGKLLAHKGYKVQAFGATPISALCKLQAKRFGKIDPLETATFDEGIIIDALFGTGYHGDVKEPFKGVIDKANSSQLPIFAIDIPSAGLIHATETLCLGLPKTSLFECWENVGHLSIHDFGLQDEYIELAEEEFDLITEIELPPIKRTRHKYEAGYVVGVGGSPGMPGAAILSSYATLKAGAGIVRLFHPAGMEAEFAGAPPEIIRSGYQDSKPILEAMEKASAVFIGPGFGLNRVDLLKELLQTKTPCVIDAEALTLVGEQNLQVPKGAILTPHAGELKRLLKEGETPQQYADTNKVILVLKGAPTYIFSPNRTPFIMAHGDPGMATAGSGDVLTGIIAGILAQTKDPLVSAKVGTYIHGIAGEIAVQQLTSYCLVASDITAALPAAYALCQSTK